MIDARRFGLLPFVLVFALLNVGCSGLFYAKLGGSLATGITFTFVDRDNQEPQEVHLRAFDIQELQNGDVWVFLWQVEGKKKLAGITYGELPQGLTEKSRPAPLVPDRQYRMIARASNSSRIEYSGLEFKIRSDGVPFLSPTKR